MNILAPTDFSPAAEETVRAAGQLAKKLRGTLTITHVLPAPTEADASADEGDRYVAARRRLDGEVEGARRAGVDARGEITVGFVDEAVENQLHRGGVGMLVLGGSPDERMRATHFAGLAACPVLMVGEAEALCEALVASRPLRVLLAVDRTQASDQPLAWVRQLRERVACDVTVMYVYWPPAEHERLGVPVKADMFAPEPSVTGALERELAERIRRLCGDVAFHIRCHPGIGAVPEVITTAASQMGADLIVVGAHQRTSWQRLTEASVSRGLLFESPHSVVCVGHDLFPRAERQPFRKILVATDLTDAGRHAVDAAFDLVGAVGTAVDIVHVRTAATSQIAGERLVERLEALVPATVDRETVHVRCFVLDGEDVAKTLLQTAARWNADAICLGSHAHGRVGRALYGSVAAELVKHASCPVLVARARPT